jgi:DNA-binding CsgD family transcriptional regulator
MLGRRPEAACELPGEKVRCSVGSPKAKSDWAIGRILNISGKTVNFHVENAKRKFGVGTRVQAVVAAMREGVISR